MLIRNVRNCEKIVAGDGCILKEILHRDKEDLSINYSLAHAVVKPKETTKPHALKNSEVYYILEGEGRMHIGDQSGIAKEKDTIYIPPGAVQFIENTGEKDLKFLCIVDPAWVPECEQVL